ncbi:reverse transcriptase, partial [Tanacetum coccineum]
HLNDKALDWHRNFERRNGLEVTWERYSEEVLQRYGPIMEDPMADLKNLRQTSTIKIYQDEFDALLSRVDITESQAVSMFFGGMNTDIAMMMFVLEVLATPEGEEEEFSGEEGLEECLVEEFSPGETFESDFMILPSGGCEMVLGIQFLSTLGDIKCNFQELRMEFKFNGKKVVLKGTKQSELQWMQGRPMSKQLEGQGEEMYFVWPSVSLNLMQGNNQQL